MIRSVARAAVQSPHTPTAHPDRGETEQPRPGLEQSLGEGEGRARALAEHPPPCPGSLCTRAASLCPQKQLSSPSLLPCRWKGLCKLTEPLPPLEGQLQLGVYCHNSVTIGAPLGSGRPRTDTRAGTAASSAQRSGLAPPQSVWVQLALGQSHPWVSPWGGQRTAVGRDVPCPGPSQSRGAKPWAWPGSPAPCCDP